MLQAFAAIYDPSRRDVDGDRRRVIEALGGADGDSRSGSLVIAWRGSASPIVAPAQAPFVFVDGTLYEPFTADVLGTRFTREGDDLFATLRGDFVIVVHDPERDELTMARDQMGGRGLFFHADGRRVAFASEARHLLAVLPVTPGPDLVALAHLLAPSVQPVDRSVYAGVRRLPGGESLKANRNGQKVSRYWNLRYRRPEHRGRDEYVSGLHDVLANAVRRRCRGPSSAIMLSGGLDSSAVAGFASTLEPQQRPRRAYSATFPDHPTIDEGDLISRLCAALDLDGTRVVVHKGSVAAGALEYIEHWRLPPQSPNLFFWLPLLRRSAADGTDVLVDGEGGDELFGLSAYLIADHLRKGRVRAASAAVRGFPGGGQHLSRSAIRPWLIRYGVKGAIPGWLQRAVRQSRGGARYTLPWMRPALVDAFMDGDTDPDWKRLSGPRWWAHLVNRVTRGSAAAMTYDHVRRRNALAGIEARHPLVDVDVIEFMLGVPPELNYDTRFSRPLLREATSGLLPDEVRLRPMKSTFDAIFHEAVAGPDLHVARALLRPGRALIEEYVDLRTVEAELLEDPPPPDQQLDWSQYLWRLLTAELWLRVSTGHPVEVPFAPAEVELR